MWSLYTQNPGYILPSFNRASTDTCWYMYPSGSYSPLLNQIIIRICLWILFILTRQFNYIVMYTRVANYPCLFFLIEYDWQWRTHTCSCLFCLLSAQCTTTWCTHCGFQSLLQLYQFCPVWLLFYFAALLDFDPLLLEW